MESGAGSGSEGERVIFWTVVLRLVVVLEARLDVVGRAQAAGGGMDNEAGFECTAARKSVLNRVNVL